MANDDSHHVNEDNGANEAKVGRLVETSCKVAGVLSGTFCDINDPPDDDTTPAKPADHGSQVSVEGGHLGFRIVDIKQHSGGIGHVDSE